MKIILQFLIQFLIHLSEKKNKEYKNNFTISNTKKIKKYLQIVQAQSCRN